MTVNLMGDIFVCINIAAAAADFFFFYSFFHSFFTYAFNCARPSPPKAGSKKNEEWNETPLEKHAFHYVIFVFFSIPAVAAASADCLSIRLYL